MNPLQLLNAITMEKQAQFKGLLYVKVRVNGQVVNAMMDCSATNNFMSQHKAGKLGLTVAKNSSKLKAMKSEVRRIQGSAAASLVVGSWEDVINMMIARHDDFDLILGAELMVKAKVSIMPHLGGIFIGDENTPCFVQPIGPNKGKEIKLQYAKLLKARVKKGQLAYVAALVELKADVVVEVPGSA